MELHERECLRELGHVTLLPRIRSKLVLEPSKQAQPVGSKLEPSKRAQMEKNKLGLVGSRREPCKVLGHIEPGHDERERSMADVEQVARMTGKAGERLCKNACIYP